MVAIEETGQASEVGGPTWRDRVWISVRGAEKKMGRGDLCTGLFVGMALGAGSSISQGLWSSGGLGQVGGGNETWQEYGGQTGGLGWGRNLRQRIGIEVGGILVHTQGSSLGLGRGAGHRVNTEWVTGTNLCISVWFILRSDGIQPRLLRRPTF